MKQELFEKISARSTGVSLATLGASHGYRFDGDTVTLHAMFTVLDGAAHSRNWALQLWACPQAPVSADDLSGHLVAQASLPPIGEIADDVESFEVRAAASYLAGQADYSMVLVLVAGNNGNYDEVHSLSVYPRRQQFQLPQIRGNAGFRVDNGRVNISVDSIYNPRCADNVSGTLSIELWALKQPYNGGDFEGVALTGATFGQVAGQTESFLREFDLSFSQPSAGTWHYVLMLREWTATGFTTRDFVNFNQTVTIAPAVTEVEAQLPQASAEPVAKAAAPVAPAKVEAAAKVEASAPKAAVTAKIEAAAPKKEVVAKVEAPASKPAKSSAKKATVAVSDVKVSVNSATAEELKTVKGMTEKVAKGIVKARPFTSLDDLAKVSGMGAKLLAKVRNYLRL